MPEKFSPDCLIAKAIQIAEVAHEGQIRKGDGLPYIVHPLAVGQKLFAHHFSPEIVAAGMVHDVLEDTNYSVEDLRRSLGEQVFLIVNAVSVDDQIPDWKAKKLDYIEKVKNGPVGAKEVCVADKIHNLESLQKAYDEHGESIWSHFNQGKEQKFWFENEVLQMLKTEMDHPLVKEYEDLLNKMQNIFQS
ncbi:MAG TPA: HD domain-containing protein [Candidatus Gracilibacteria bacterium]|nr:HD domain-containing protein [Candidatus Gracilibacteria bacterium]